MSVKSEHTVGDAAYWDWFYSQREAGLIRDAQDDEPEMVCTYQRENGRAPCCTHQCDGCVWCEERWPDDDE